MARCVKNHPGQRTFGQSGGTILFLAMVFLLLLGLSAQALLKSSTLAMRMADNFHSQEVAEQIVVSFAREVGDDLSSFDLAAEVGQVRCLNTSALTTCDAKDIFAPLSLSILPPDAVVELSVERQYPHHLHRLSLREPERIVSSALTSRYAVYEVDVRVQAGSRAATAQIRRGVAVREPL